MAFEVKVLKATALVSFLILSFGTGMLFVQQVSANFIPEQPPAGIVISADGRVDGTDLLHYEDGVYEFMDDIHRTIVVERDNIVFDGGGHNLQGSGGSVGFFLQSRNGVEIRNLTISNFEIGIKFTWQIYYTQPPAETTRNALSGNTVANNTYGVLFSDPYTRVTLRNNVFLGNQYSVSDDVSSGNDVDASNTVNSKPICYWVNEHDKTVPSNAGFVVLKNCTGIAVKNLDLEGNMQGILLYYTNDSLLEGNLLTNNFEGITLRHAFNNTISGNHVTTNTQNGVHLEYNSIGNTITGNVIEFNGQDGIYDGYYSYGEPLGNAILNNQIRNNNGNGVAIYVEQNTVIVGNNITSNAGCGVRLAYGATNATIRGNFIAKNALGIQIESPSPTIVNTDMRVNGTMMPVSSTVTPKGSTIMENTVTENNGWGIRLNNTAGGNIVYHNNFINNHVAEGLQVSIPAIMVFDLYAPPEIGPTMAPGNANVWDNGEEGNYWSDYSVRYANASEVGSSGVGDSPFYINENNIDRYPLLSPFNPFGQTPPTNQPSTDPSQVSDTDAKLIPPSFFVIAIGVGVVASAAVAVGCIITFRKRSCRVEKP
jgi:parallel beta-helix repeat protein